MVDKNKVDKAFERKSAKQLLSAPVSALQGVSEKDSVRLEKSFKIKTIEDMANCEWYNKALAIKKKAAGK